MKYGDGFVVLRRGRVVTNRKSPYAYPSTRGFEYDDGTRERGDLLTETFVCLYTAPSGRKFKITIIGNAVPLLYQNAFDFDFASIELRILRALSCDKADYRIRVPSLLHDGVFASRPSGWTFHDANVMLREVIEAYSDDTVADAWLREKVFAAVSTFGLTYWHRAESQAERYRKLVKVKEI